jgi:hypothetical protein
MIMLKTIFYSITFLQNKRSHCFKEINEKFYSTHKVISSILKGRDKQKNQKID